MNTHEYTIDEPQHNLRLDRAIASLCADISRSSIQKMIVNGQVSINGQTITSKKHPVALNDCVQFTLIETTQSHDQPQALQLDTQYEDEDVWVINKPAGLVVHPGAGVPDHTLLNAIIAQQPQNHTLPQAGLIHRLDKDTTGLLIIAKNAPAHFQLTQDMANRLIKRHYLALVRGVIHKGGTIDQPLARHPKHRKKFTVNPHGRHAITHYDIHERFDVHTLLKVQLETGRTHQIRVHLHHIGYPIVGDLTYHRGQYLKKHTLSTDVLNALYHFKRQALHAASLTFTQPTTKKDIQLACPLPQDFADLLSLLRAP